MKPTKTPDKTPQQLSIESVAKLSATPVSDTVSTVTPESGKIPESPEGAIVDNAALLKELETHTSSGESVSTTSPGTPDSPIPHIAATPGSKPFSMGGVIGGDFAVNMMDSIFPSLVVLVISYAGYSADSKQLKLTTKEKETISPVMQAYLDSINLDFKNPLYNLLFVVGAVYAGKFMEIMPELKKKNQPAKTPLSTIDGITKKMQDEKDRQEKIKGEIAELKKMDKPIALRWIVDKKKLSKEKAAEWYNKNVR